MRSPVSPRAAALLAVATTLLTALSAQIFENLLHLPEIDQRSLAPDKATRERTAGIDDGLPRNSRSFGDQTRPAATVRYRRRIAPTRRDLRTKPERSARFR